MMTRDDISRLCREAEEHRLDAGTNDAVADGVLALWVIAEQLGAISHNLSQLSRLAEAVDPSAGDRFPGVLRVRIQDEGGR